MLLTLAGGVGCCSLPNTRYPEPESPHPETTIILYGDSFVNRLSTLTGYSTPLGARLASRGEAVGDEGNAGREAAIGAIEDPSTIAAARWCARCSSTVFRRETSRW